MKRSLLSPSTLAAVVAVALVGLSGCASQFQGADKVFGVFTPYRMDIVQGNVVTKELLEGVQLGMTRQQVRDRLGTPTVTDLFHADRWDYPFLIRRQGAANQDRSIVLHFEGDKLLRIVAPELPTEREFVAAISLEHKKFEPRKLELTEAERAALPLPPPRAASAAEASGPVRSYPPLESPS